MGFCLKKRPKGSFFFSKKDIGNLITFLESKENISLLGNKLDQYYIWKSKE